MKHSIETSQVILVAIQAALQAGEILRRGYGTDYQVQSKPGRHNFVTDYDHAAEKAILETIKQHFPDHAILAEESGSAKGATESSILWIIDPLDGTTNFTRHLPLFCVSIAVYYKGEVVCAVIYQPITSELFVAEKGRGAYLNGTRLSVSTISDIDKAIIGVGLPYQMDKRRSSLKHVAFFTEGGVPMRNLGSAALSLAYVAAGKIDGFWIDHLQPWDIAAGQLLITEAGGLVTNYEGTSPDLTQSSSAIAGNPFIHGEILKLFK